jgi:hypothetical protein
MEIVVKTVAPVRTFSSGIIGLSFKLHWVRAWLYGERDKPLLYGQLSHASSISLVLVVFQLGLFPLIVCHMFEYIPLCMFYTKIHPFDGLACSDDTYLANYQT